MLPPPTKANETLYDVDAVHVVALLACRHRRHVTMSALDVYFAVVSAGVSSFVEAYLVHFVDDDDAM